MALPTRTDLSTLVVPGEKPIQHFKIAGLFEDEWMQLPDDLKNAYEYNPETRQYTLSELEWLKWRKHGPYHEHPDDARYIDVTLGGSDIAVLFDGSKLSEELYLYEGQHGSNFKAAIELFYEKTGRKLALQEKKNADVLWIGHNEEPSIRSMFKRMYQNDHPLDIVNIYNDNHMYQCGKRDKMGKLSYPFVLCDLDGIVEINCIKGVFEAKTCNKGSEDYQLWKNGAVPLKYYLQCCWYMLCMNLPYAYIAVKWGLSTSEFRYMYIERNFEVEELILEMAQDFIWHVKNNIEPSTDGQNVERLCVFWRKKMGNPKTSEEKAVLSDELKDDVMELSYITDEIASLQKKINELQTQKKEILVRSIFPNINDSSVAEVDYSPVTKLELTVREKRNRIKVDTERLMKEQPELYEHYLVTETSFNERLFMQEQQMLMETYGKEDDSLTDSMTNFCKVRAIKKK